MLLTTSLAILLSLPAAPAAPQRVRLVPQFEPGQSLRYQMEFRSLTEGSTEGPLENPHAPAALEMTITALVRFDVLRVRAAGSSRAVRLRATYEKLASHTRGDSADPRLEEADRRFASLEGRSIEFTLDAAGKVSEMTGLEDVVPEEQTAVEQWLAQLSLGIRHPEAGIVPGQRWTAEETQATLAPLRGLAWRTESTYLRNEPCLLAGAAPPEAREADCAVLLTRFEIVQRGRGDPTPEEFRQQGLRTRGTVSGTGESLSYVSLETGLVVSVTHTGEEEMDLTIESAEEAGPRVRYRGRIRSHSQITLLPIPAVR